MRSLYLRIIFKAFQPINNYKLNIKNNKMGFIEDLTVYCWNWTVWIHIMLAEIGCWVAGGWGLFFDDDDGLMQ